MFYLFVWLRGKRSAEIYHTEPSTEDLTFVADGKLKIFRVTGDMIEEYDPENNPEDVWQEVMHQY